jgi:hypothetical protein
MTNSYNRARHILALYVDEVQEVPGMIKPASCWCESLATEHFQLKSNSIATYDHFPNGPR